jgi:CRP/FNR family cyclic AMP-dependent transcriptional regulator
MSERSPELPHVASLSASWNEPIEADEIASLARRYAAEGMFDEAIHLYEMACKLRPGSVPLEISLARVRERKKLAEDVRYRQVRTDVLAERDRDEMDASQYVGLAQFYIETDQTAKAIELLEIAKLRSPNNHRPFEILGRLHFSVGEWDLALVEIDRARKLNPFDRELAIISGRLNFELKHYEGAISDFVDAFLLTPDRRGEATEAIRRMITTLKRIQNMDNVALHALVREQLNALALFAERLEFRKENLFRLESRGVLQDILQKVTRDAEKRGSLIALSAELRQLGVFQHLRDEQVFRLARFARTEKIARGEYLFRDGDRSMNFYAIREGEFEIRKETPVGPHVFARIGPDSILGEMNFLDRTYRSCDALAAVDSVCYSFAFSSLDQISEQDRETAVALHWAFWKSLTTKVRTANEQLRKFFPEAGSAQRTGPASSTPEAVDVESGKKMDLFEERGLSAAEMKLLATFSEEERFAGGAALFREGDAGDKLYIVMDGRVRISKFIPGIGEEALAVLGRGEFFGEMALIDDQPRSADAWAHEGDATVLAIDRSVLQEVLSMDPAASLQFLNLLCRLISRRLREIDEKLVQWKMMAGGF